MIGVSKLSVFLTDLYGVLAENLMFFNTKCSQLTINQNYKGSNWLQYLVVFYNLEQ